jgi:predicted permease
VVRGYVDIYSGGFACFTNFPFRLGIQRWKRLDIKPISTVAIYILTPMLVFQTFYRAELNKQYAIMVLFSVLLLIALIIINKVYCKVRSYNPSVESELAEIKLFNMQWEKISFGVIVRSLISPLITVVIVWLIPMDPILQKKCRFYQQQCLPLPQQ